jgi:hypothetical protein
MARRILALGLLVVFVTGCASAPKVGVYGRSVTVVTTGTGEKVEGELLAVEDDRLFVREKNTVTEVPLPDVKEIRVKRHNFGARAALTWALAGGVLTGGALAGACSSVEGNSGCATVGLVTAGAWLLVGALAAPAMEHSSRETFRRPLEDQVRPYSRLPQGLPEGTDPASLAVGPPKDE